MGTGRIALAILIASLLLINQAFATVQVVQYFTHAPVSVCVPSDTNGNCGGAGGGVGVGTINAGTQGYVAVYQSGSHTLGQAATPIFDNGNVGISSVNPGQKLDVQGTARMTGFLLSTNPLAGDILMGNGVGIGSWVPASAVASNTSFANPSATIGLSANNGSATTAMRSDATPALGVTISPTWTGNHIFAPSSGNTIISAGNLGIGTNAPLFTLQVQGAIGVGTFQVCTAQGLCPYQPSGNYLTTQWWNQGFGNVGVSTVVPGGVGIGTINTGNGAMAILGNVGIGTWGATANLDVEGAGTIKAAGQITANNYNSTGSTIPANGWTQSAANQITFATNSLQNLVISSNGNVGMGTLNVAGNINVANGNVGIGTYSACNTNGLCTQYFQPTISLTTTGTSGASTLTGNALNIPQYTGGAGSNYWGLTNVGISTGQPNNITNVGIGTSTYASTLNVVGNIGIGTVASSNYILTSAPNGGMQIEGNVGIGTNVPYSLLDVEGTLRNAVFFANGKTASSGFGNFGIGTLAPMFPLQIVGNVGIGTTATNTTTKYALVINNVATFNSEFQIASNIGVGTTNVNWNNGIYQNVGIGTNGTNTYITFTHPTNGNVGKLQLRILEDATGGRALPFWPATVKWSQGTIPTLSGANKSDFVNCEWNGTTDYCAGMLNF